ncbi:Beta-cyclopiazonate dehydrogenase like protein [Verticillium longisporum]|uniref:Beta-cyclopiazonate dehydrogenase like protein n=1 Tax=Verticillium longisporum TaxID=100787 RepID=A0A8I3ASR5_VERLO|nr:Beta-cyclopiazonate dehydrogenase like protein [Verticillium longisporum]
MHFHHLSLWALAASSVQAAASAPETNVDVLIIGGGATGAYAATQLRDQGKKVLVVESEKQLGGHVDTFIDQATGAPIDYGVQAYILNNQTQNFFGRFNVALNASTQSPFPTKLVDFKTGFVVPNATATDILTLLGPIGDYITAVSSYTGIAQGYYDIPQPVDPQLLEPFSKFVARNNLTAEMVQLVWQFAHGVGNLFDTPTLYVLQNFGLPHILGLAAGYVYSPAGNQLLYDRVAAFLGKDVLYSSRVVSSTRTTTGVTAVVQGACGTRTVRAKKLLITIPPTRKNLAVFNLDNNEKKLFDQFSDVPYHVGIIRKSSMPDLTNFYNVDLQSPTLLPSTPFAFRFETTGVPGYQTVKVIGEPSNAKARTLALTAAKTVGNAVSGTPGNPSTAAWGQHKDLGLHVPIEAVADGFYSKLYDLQGGRSTWFTGNAWCSDYSPLLWAYTDERILPNLL